MIQIEAKNLPAPNLTDGQVLRLLSDMAMLLRSEPQDEFFKQDRVDIKPFTLNFYPIAVDESMAEDLELETLEDVTIIYSFKRRMAYCREQEADEIDRQIVLSRKLINFIYADVIIRFFRPYMRREFLRTLKVEVDARIQIKMDESIDSLAWQFLRVEAERDAQGD